MNALARRISRIETQRGTDREEWRLVVQPPRRAPEAAERASDGAGVESRLVTPKEQP